MSKRKSTRSAPINIVKMISLLSISLLASVLLASGCLPNGGNDPPQTPIIETISPQEAFDLIQESQGNLNFVIYDVRAPEKYAESHLENARLLDYSKEPFFYALDRLDKKKIYLFYEDNPCLTCVPLAGGLPALLEDTGFREAYMIRGGFESWVEEGFPITE